MNTPKCPICGSSMVPMKGKASGKGWNCSTATWSRQAGPGGCRGVRWIAKTYVKREAVERPTKYPTVPMSAEQISICEHFSQSPESRGSRLTIIDAVAGSGKTTSNAKLCESIAKRVGFSGLVNWRNMAFGVNASASIESKVPLPWQVGTINATLGRLQGYNRTNYDARKCNRIFKDLIAGLPKKEQPSFGCLRAFCERTRDGLLYRDDDGDKGFWTETIALISARFPGLAKQLNVGSNAETVADYLPAVLVRCMAESGKVDLTEQYCRPALEAIKQTGWKLPQHLVSRNPEWSDDDIRHLAGLVKATKMPQVSAVVDEFQDLSLSQVVTILAATWKTGELALIGDDTEGTPDDENYKAGQAIFSWRGAGGGMGSLIPRVWQELTGEQAIRLDLTVTFRVPPSGVENCKAFCPRMVSAKTEPGEVVNNCDSSSAFQSWLELESGKTALWLSRRNAPLGPVFIETIKERKQVCLRGNDGFLGQIDGALFEAAGWYDASGEYSVSLTTAIAKLQDLAAEEDNSDDSTVGLLLSVATAIQQDPKILTEAAHDDLPLKPVATVGNLRRFIVHFASKNAPRVCSTVYRSKGDEADLVIVDDVEQFNNAWNDDARERNAVAFVALTRHKETLLVLGTIDPPM